MVARRNDRNREMGERVKRVRTAPQRASQTELAELVGAQQQSTVAAWESGKNIPEPKVLVRLALLASEKKLHSDAIWFLRQAGIGPEQLKKLLPEIRTLDKRLAGASGAYAIPVRPKEYFLGDETAADHKIRDIVLPAEIVDDHTTTSCLIVDKDMGGFAFRPGDVIVIDESKKTPPSCWGEAVLIAQKQYLGATELLIGSLNMIPFVPGEYQRWVVTIDPLTGGPILLATQQVVTDIKNEERRFLSGVAIDRWNLEKLPKLNRSRHQSPDEQMQAFARNEYRIGAGSAPAWRIIGRIVGWLREKRK